MPVTFQDKDNTLPTSDPRKLIRAVDVNELKQVINATEAVANAVDASLDAVLASAPSGYDTFLEVGNKLTSLDTLKAPIDSPTFTGTVSGISKSMVGLGNVDNTSDATKNSATATLTNKTLTSPVINSPTGIVKGDIGLGNVDNTSDATKLAAVFAKFVFKETPTGTIDGVNDDFTIAFSAVTVIGVYGDGTVINSANYTVVGTALTITNALVIPTNSLQIDYIK